MDDWRVTVWTPDGYIKTIVVKYCDLKQTVAELEDDYPESQITWDPMPA